MSTRPTNDLSGNTAANQEPPPLALAIGILPAGLPEHLAPNGGSEPWHHAGEHDDGIGNGRALAIGPSGPPIRLLSEAELAARASAVNFNPNHDELGRFATGGGAAAPHGPNSHLPELGARLHRLVPDGQDQHRQHGELLAQRRGVAEATAKPKQPEVKEYHGAVTLGAFSENYTEGDCMPACMREAIAQIETVRTAADQPDRNAPAIK